ncbi:hypothetical protein [Cellvibrio sp. OA-2007]|uniref:hypothetical protein n=1 Tax=Cellvibrio sp. OA-2007 TaxID=529823 RepID=UPI000782EF70|nr:hypothetical protein [Cellvibrio sp. OA-2007]
MKTNKLRIRYFNTMNKFILLFTIVMTTTATAQTLEETKDWILTQSEFNLDGRLKYDIIDGQFISLLTLPYALGGDTIKKSIPIEKISKISIIKTDKYISFSLICDKPCTTQDDDISNQKTVFLFEIYKTLDASFSSRMQKALFHLVELHKGKARIVNAEVKKEAF